MTSRLSTIAEDLAEQLSRQPAGRLRRVAAAAAGLAVERTQLLDPRLDVALAAVRGHDPAAVADRSQVLALAEELDDHAWEAQEQAEAGLLPEQAYVVAFALARAAATVGCALEPDALKAALESVYEAQAAVDDLAAIRGAVAAALAD
jgi:hypothetical protein